MHSWLWVKCKLCQYEFIMGTRRPSKETLTQPYQTIVSIERLPCLRIDATSCHEACKKIASTWARTVNWNLHFRLPNEFHWNCHDNQKATWQSNIKNNQCKYKVLCICKYIYAVFAEAVYLGRTYILIFTWSTNWHNNFLCFKLLLAKELCHSYIRTIYQKPIVLQKTSCQE